MQKETWQSIEFPGKSSQRLISPPPKPERRRASPLADAEAGFDDDLAKVVLARELGAGSYKLLEEELEGPAVAEDHGRHTTTYTNQAS